MATKKAVFGKDEGHEEIKIMLTELQSLFKAQGEQLKSQNKLIEKLGEQLTAIQQDALKRAHLDTKIIEIDDVMNDNGKPGLKSIRNEWISQKNQKNVIIAAIVIQIALNIIIK